MEKPRYWKKREMKYDKYFKLPSNEEMIVSILKETIHEEVAEKLLLEFTMSGENCFAFPSPEKIVISFNKDGYVIPNEITLRKGSFSTTIYDRPIADEDPIYEMNDYSYTVENIHSVFDDIIFSNTEWVENNLIIKVRRVDEEDDE